jgi:uncharacterized protein (UPF0264 family)
MQLLVSVCDVQEATAALVGGAHVIDAKDPSRGPLGAVAPDVFDAIVVRVGGTRPVSAALGDAADEAALERAARQFADRGATFVKIGFAGIADGARAVSLLAAAVRGATTSSGCGVVAVAYADFDRVGAPSPEVVTRVAADAGATGVLLDTADKSGPGSLDLLSIDGLSAWATSARRAGLTVALAGRLSGVDIDRRCRSGIDIDVVGVRGAACDGGRQGRVSSAKVRALVELVGRDDDDVETVGPGAVEPGIHEVVG